MTLPEPRNGNGNGQPYRRSRSEVVALLVADDEPALAVE